MNMTSENLLRYLSAMELAASHAKALDIDPALWIAEALEARMAIETRPRPGETVAGGAIVRDVPYAPDDRG